MLSGVWLVVVVAAEQMLPSKLPTLAAILGGKGSAHASNDPKCQCGCVPNIMSLHEQAKERARRREAEAARKPTLTEYLAKTPGEQPAQWSSTMAMECDDQTT